MLYRATQHIFAQQQLLTSKHQLNSKEVLNMPPLRRSMRIAEAEKLKAEATKSSEHVDNKSSSCNTDKRIPRTRSRSKARKSCCSLQSLEMQHEHDKRGQSKRTKSPKKTGSKSRKKRTVASSPLDANTYTTKTTAPPTTPSTKSGFTSTAIVTPGTTNMKKKGVKFNLGRNSIAQYNKENPPNIVEQLSNEVVETYEVYPLDDGGCNDVDETTWQNEELLAEWDSSFEDFDVNQRRQPRRRVRMISYD